MMESRKKTNPCTKATKIPRAMIGSGAKKAPAKTEKNGQNDFVSHHVSEKTEGERQNPCQVTDDFDDEDQRRHPPHGSHKVFDILGAMVFDTNDVGEDHDNDQCDG